MSYISAQQAADQWKISKRRVQFLCSTQRIMGAVRIGNMWVVPKDAKKPDDARKKTQSSTANAYINPIKIARKFLKAIPTSVFQSIKKEIRNASDSKKIVMALFTRVLLYHIIETNNETEENINVSRIYNLFGVNKQVSLTTDRYVTEQFQKFLVENPFCIDDALSWAYQFVNKISLDTGLESTQFFTEKYMITTLVDQSKIESNIGKILDPACGGANFLLYALDYLCDSTRLPSMKSPAAHLQVQLERLHGYELDPDLAAIASVNLRIKSMLILKANNYSITADDFFFYTPQIYYSAKSNIEGSLDLNSQDHSVIKVGTTQTSSLLSVLDSAAFVFTNPPFKTVKGMDKELKSFLNDNYPMAKCDMCNAFIELALNSLSENGVCGIVTQNSWMYLDSFEQFRFSFLGQYSVKSIIELGSNAFYDINGEKSNVVLLVAQKTQPSTNSSIATCSLKNFTQPEIEQVLSSGQAIHCSMKYVNQSEIINRQGRRFNLSGTNRMQALQNKHLSYGEYATPMQGTSTGNTKALVGYFWEHIGDSDWLPVSKGGGYSRWLGLNNYSVKWGQDGEYIKNTPGSAIRNAKHFNNTQMVFSDTGTAGLNVRLLRDGQIFIASGPGIRVTHGETLAHLAFLNSRFASYFIKLLSPKLTIAGGYIAKIPLLEEVLHSKDLIHNAEICIELKKNRLMRRPINLEFEPIINMNTNTTLDEQVYQWLINDIESEWLQLRAEKEIDKAILDAYGLCALGVKDINALVGSHAFDIVDDTNVSVTQLDQSLSGLMTANCVLNRTLPAKNRLGCDGILEFLTHKYNIASSKIRTIIVQNTEQFQNTLEKYRNAYIHNLVLSSLGYTIHSLPKNLPKKLSVVVDDIAVKYPSLASEVAEIENWIKTSLTSFHQASFLGKPIIQYSSEHNLVELLIRISENHVDNRGSNRRL